VESYFAFEQSFSVLDKSQLAIKTKLYTEHNSKFQGIFPIICRPRLAKNHGRQMQRFDKEDNLLGDIRRLSFRGWEGTSPRGLPAHHSACKPWLTLPHD
jgi:hypothetical protein